MMPYYSIFFASIRSAIKEQISIAMCLVSQNRIYFRYSDAKLKLVKELLTRNHAELLEQQLKSLAKQADILNAKLSADELFSLTEEQIKPFSKSYLDYLHRYSQNTLQISEPSDLTLPSETDLNAAFSKLYELHVQAKTDNLASDQAAHEIYNAKSKLSRNQQSRININVNTKKIKEFYKFEKALFLLPPKIDFIGQNGIPVTGQFLNMQVETKWLKDRLSHYYHLLDELRNKHSINYLVSNEPDKNLFSENHKIWQQVRENRQIQYVHLSNIAEIEAYLINNNVRPLFNDEMPED